jgi:hypothetical protein
VDIVSTINQRVLFEVNSDLAGILIALGVAVPHVKPIVVEHAPKWNIWTAPESGRTYIRYSCAKSKQDAMFDGKPEHAHNFAAWCCGKKEVCPPEVVAAYKAKHKTTTPVGADMAAMYQTAHQKPEKPLIGLPEDFKL